jgi:hypothetical protein
MLKMAETSTASGSQTVNHIVPILISLLFRQAGDPRVASCLIE